MKWIFLSPHLDDAVFSCGGFIWEKVHRGDAVEIWTIFTSAPSPSDLTPFAQSLHARWGVGMDAMATRRTEDQQACSRLGAAYRLFDFLDCIYRHFPENRMPVVRGEDDLFQPHYQSEPQLVLQIAGVIGNAFPGDARMVGPLALGNHIDHQLVKEALLQVDPGASFYADYPYAGSIEDIREIPLPGLQQKYLQSISSIGLKYWQEAIAAYQTQTSTFWDDVPEMERALEAYWRGGGGCVLWGKA